MSGTLRSLQTTVQGAVKRLSADLYSGEALQKSGIACGVSDAAACRIRRLVLQKTRGKALPSSGLGLKVVEPALALLPGPLHARVVAECG